MLAPALADASGAQERCGGFRGAQLGEYARVLGGVAAGDCVGVERVAVSDGSVQVADHS